MDRLCVGLSRVVSTPVYITANTGLFAMGVTAIFAAFSDSYCQPWPISSLLPSRHRVSLVCPSLDRTCDLGIHMPLALCHSA